MSENCQKYQKKSWETNLQNKCSMKIEPKNSPEKIADKIFQGPRCNAKALGPTNDKDNFELNTGSSLCKGEANLKMIWGNFDFISPCVMSRFGGIPALNDKWIVPSSKLGNVAMHLPFSSGLIFPLESFYLHTTFRKVFQID